MEYILFVSTQWDISYAIAIVPMPSAKETWNVKVENGTLPTMPLKEY